jgi:type III pantothenate kinase
MILLADAGNSRIKWVAYEDGMFRKDGLFHYSCQELMDAAAHQWRDLPRPSRVLIVSVAGPEASSALTKWIKDNWDIEAEFVTATATACGIQNAYSEEPSRLGADRWVAMIAARALTQQTCYVVDCGTALTIDAIAANGQHLGGVIVPGIQLMRQALYRETQQILPEQGEFRLFGKSTRDCVWGGTIYAVAAAIDGITDRMMATGGPGIRFLTGGGAEMISAYLLGKFQLQPDLVFYGLRLIAEQREELLVSSCHLALSSQLSAFSKKCDHYLP